MDSLKVLEKDVQRACIDYLDAKRIMYLRLNAGDTFRPGQNGKLYKVRGAPKGTADLLILEKERGKYCKDISDKAMLCPRPIFVEFKSSKGKQTDEQELFSNTVELLGYEYYVVRDLDELVEVLK